jgi:hypothetical protein
MVPQETAQRRFDGGGYRRPTPESSNAGAGREARVLGMGCAGKKPGGAEILGRQREGEGPAGGEVLAGGASSG